MNRYSYILFFLLIFLFHISCEPFETYLYDRTFQVSDQESDYDDNSDEILYDHDVEAPEEYETDHDQFQENFTEFNTNDIPVWSLSLIIATSSEDDSDSNDDLAFKMSEKGRLWYLDSPYNDFEKGTIIKYYVAPFLVDVYKVSDINYLYLLKESDGFYEKTGNFKIDSIELKINEETVLSQKCEDSCWFSNRYGLDKTYNIEDYSALRTLYFPKIIKNEDLLNTIIFYISGHFQNTLMTTMNSDLDSFLWNKPEGNKLEYLSNYSVKTTFSIKKGFTSVTTEHIAEIIFSIECEQGKIKIKPDMITVTPFESSLFSGLESVLNKDIFASYNNLVTSGYLSYNCKESYFNDKGDLILGWTRK